MDLLALRTRIEWRRHWRSFLVTMVLFGLAGGAALAAFAGAVRTGTAAERFAEESRSADVLVLPNGPTAFEALRTETIEKMPGVVAVQEMQGIVAFPVEVSADEDPNDTEIQALMLPEATRPEAGALLTQGRFPAQTEVDEVLINPRAAARYGWGVGDRVELRLLPELTQEEATAFGDEFFGRFMAGEVGTVVSFTVVGVAEDLSDVTVGVGPSVQFTEAFHDEVGSLAIYNGFDVYLDAPESRLDFETAVASLVHGAPVGFQRTQDQIDKQHASLAPAVTSLFSFGVVMAAVVVAIWLQAAVRHRRLTEEFERTLAAVGADRGHRLRMAAVRSTLLALMGAAISIAVAYAVSPLLPVGVARRIEPHPGLDFDPAILLGGAGLLVLAPVAVSLLVVRGAPGRTRPDRRRGSGAARWLIQNVASAPMAVGIRHALEPEGDSELVPTRSTLVTAGLGTAVTVAVFVFAFGLAHFAQTPASYGWSSIDIVTSVSGNTVNDAGVGKGVLEKVRADPRVEAAGFAAILQGEVAGEPDTLVGIGDGQGELGGTLLDGRLPATGREVALGRVTAREAGKSIGDLVEIGVPGSTKSFRVVGTVVTPGISSGDGEVQTLGHGAELTIAGLKRAADLDDTTEPPQVVIDLKPGVAPADFAPALLAMYPDDYADALPEGPSGLARTLKPTELGAYESSVSTIFVLAALLAVLAGATVALAIAVSVRRRHRAMGTLAALGFTRGQISSSVVWQATAVALVGAGVGTVVGVVLGRIAWLTVSRQIGIEPVSPVPWLAVLLAVPVGLVVANLAGAYPARAASRVRPAEALRSE